MTTRCSWFGSCASPCPAAGAAASAAGAGCAAAEAVPGCSTAAGGAAASSSSLQASSSSCAGSASPASFSRSRISSTAAISCSTACSSRQQPDACRSPVDRHGMSRGAVLCKARLGVIVQVPLRCSLWNNLASMHLTFVQLLRLAAAWLRRCLLQTLQQEGGHVAFTKQEADVHDSGCIESMFSRRHGYTAAWLLIRRSPEPGHPVQGPRRRRRSRQMTGVLHGRRLQRRPSLVLCYFNFRYNTTWRGCAKSVRKLKCLTHRVPEGRIFMLLETAENALRVPQDDDTRGSQARGLEQCG